MSVVVFSAALADHPGERGDASFVGEREQRAQQRDELTPDLRRGGFQTRRIPTDVRASPASASSGLDDVSGEHRNVDLDLDVVFDCDVDLNVVS